MSLITYEYRIGAQWAIEKSEVRNSQNCKSPTYVISNLSGIKYYFTLYPFVGDSPNPYVSIMLNFESKEKITVSCTICVATASLKCEMNDLVFDKNCKSYHSKLTTRSMLFDPGCKFFGTDQLLKIKLDGTIRLQLPQPQKEQPANAFGPLSLSQALWKKEDKDVTIVAEKKEIMVKI
uniref:Uncharacterized protein n=1 Tax=Panagrolaimus davidi TaxID=227884 RepID=A0A914PSU2_9BILA